MAPVSVRQYYYSLPPPRHPKAPAGTPPVAVSTRISFTVFMQLFAGTVGIFILAVLAWKIGAFSRSLTRHRLHRPGRKTDDRYARTWYGWVPLRTHNKLKALFNWWSIKYYEFTAWQTSRADYHWVWWDPGQKGFEEYRRRRQKVRRWLPHWLHSYGFTAADEIWNPGRSPATGRLSLEFREKGALQSAKTAAAPEWRKGSVAGQPQTFPGSLITRKVRPTVQPLCDRVYLSAGPVRDSSRNGLHHAHLMGILRRARTDISTPLLRDEQGHNVIRLAQPEYKRRLASITEHEEFVQPRLPLAPVLQEYIHSLQALGAHCRPAAYDSGIGNGSERTEYRMKRKARKYQAWAARLQIQSNQLVGHQGRRAREPPGTPTSDLFSSFASDETTALHSLSELTGALNSKLSNGSQPASNTAFCTSKVEQMTDRANVERTSYLVDLGCDFARLPVSTVRKDGRQKLAVPIHHPTPPARAYCTMGSSQNGHMRFIPPHGKSRGHDSTQPVLALNGLTDWEIRLIDGLDRRLEWLASEIDPGRKPYNFAVIANHWLNRETWLVYDPISRVSKDAKRKLGDPRFNMPYPEPNWGPKPKFPANRQRRAQIPHIDSWRAAVNKSRKTSGTRGTLKLVELFDGSVEDPPDGRVDPASWILPKPPQGFALSRREGEAYYEGGAGWQETLEDWREVRRGYRIRKAIFEGKVNRMWLREVTVGFADGCRSVSSKVATRAAATYRRGEKC